MSELPEELQKRFEEMAKQFVLNGAYCSTYDRARLHEGFLEGIQQAAPILVAHTKAEGLEEAAKQVRLIREDLINTNNAGGVYAAERIIGFLIYEAQAEREKARKG